MTIEIHSLVILIPAKNEEQTIERVIMEIRQLFTPVPVVVIDDASTDRTAELAKMAGAVVLPLPFSLGAWGAIQTGLRYALQQGFHTAITMDADGQHEADSIPDLLYPIAIGQADVVIGAYPQRGSLLRKIAWSVFRQLSGLALEDLTSGLRAYHRPAIELLASHQATLLDYQDLGVLILLQKHGLRIEEVPTLMYPRRNGHSRIFSSWRIVSYYMIQTGIFCLAHHGPRNPPSCPIK